MTRPRHRRRYVLLGHHLILQRDYTRFGCDEFKRRGYEVRLISCWNVLRNGQNLDTQSESFRNAPGVETPNSREELFDFLDTLQPTDFILPMVGLTYENYWLFRALSERGLRYSFVNRGKIPSTYLLRLTATSGVRRLLGMTFRNARQFLTRLYNKLHLVAQIGLDYWRIDGPLIEIRGGVYQAPFTSLFPFSGKSEKVDVEGFELFWAKQSEDDPAVTTVEKYALFLEGGVGNQPDAAIWNIPRPKTIDLYFESLRKTLDKVEANTGHPVIIALHPKSSYSKSEADRLFGGRVTIQGKTAQLARNASCILVHYSTSMSFAAIYRKPILFLTNSTLRDFPEGEYVDFMASWFEQVPLDMDLIDDQSIAIPPVRDDVIDRYVHNFLRAKNASDEPAWVVVSRTFEHLMPFTPNRPSL